jgi:hypothetical protein
VRVSDCVVCVCVRVGWPVSSLRSAMLTSAQLGTYDSIKNNLLKDSLGMSEGTTVQLCASMLSSVVTTTVANPVDVIKTRYMSDAVGKYSGIIHCVTATYRDGGVRCFFRVRAACVNEHSSCVCLRE